ITRTAHPRRASSPYRVRKNDPCPLGCATAELARARPRPVHPDHPAVETQRWISAAITDGQTRLPAIPHITIDAASLLTSIATLTRIALDGLTATGGKIFVHGHEVDAPW